jgi:hypothetical protein
MGVCMAPRHKESVGRWLLVDNFGHYSVDEYGSQFSEKLAEAYVFSERPRKTIAVRAVPVILSLIRGAD